jgi:hypothetical protein
MHRGPIENFQNRMERMSLAVKDKQPEVADLLMRGGFAMRKLGRLVEQVNAGLDVDVAKELEAVSKLLEPKDR